MRVQDGGIRLVKVCVWGGGHTFRGLFEAAQPHPVVQTTGGVKLVHVITGESLPQVTGDNLTGLVVFHASHSLALDPQGLATGQGQLFDLADGFNVACGIRGVVAHIYPVVILNAGFPNSGRDSWLSRWNKGHCGGFGGG